MRSVHGWFLIFATVYSCSCIVQSVDIWIRRCLKGYDLSGTFGVQIWATKATEPMVSMTCHLPSTAGASRIQSLEFEGVRAQDVLKDGNRFLLIDATFSLCLGEVYVYNSTTSKACTIIRGVSEFSVGETKSFVINSSTTTCSGTTPKITTGNCTSKVYTSTAQPSQTNTVKTAKTQTKQKGEAINPTGTNSGSDTNDDTKWMLIGVGAVCFFLLLLLAFALCKIVQKRSQLKKAMGADPALTDPADLRTQPSNKSAFFNKSSFFTSPGSKTGSVSPSDTLFGIPSLDCPQTVNPTSEQTTQSTENPSTGITTTTSPANPSPR